MHVRTKETDVVFYQEMGSTEDENECGFVWIFFDGYLVSYLTLVTPRVEIFQTDEIKWSVAVSIIHGFRISHGFT